MLHPIPPVFRWLAGWLFVLFSLFTASAHASVAKSNYEIDWVANTTVRGNDGEVLYLGRHLRSDVFFLPYNIADEGYVLGVKGSPTDYYPLPPERIRELQQTGMLPTPLPAYRIKLIDQIIGNALWIPLLAVLLYMLLRWTQVLHARKQKFADEFSSAAMGNLLASYQKDWSLQKLHYLLMIFSYLPLAWGWSNTSLPFLLLGLLILTPGLLMLVSQFNYQVCVYEKGLTILGPLDAGIISFSTELCIFENHARNSSSMAALFSGRLNDCLILENRSGTNQRLVIPSNIAKLGELLTRLRQLQEKILLPYLLEKYENGSSVDFSGLKIRKTQLMTANKVINANDIGSIEVKNSFYGATLIIREKTAQRIFYRLDLSSLANFCALIPLLNMYFNPATRRPFPQALEPTATDNAGNNAGNKLAPAQAEIAAKSVPGNVADTAIDPIAESLFAAIAERRKIEPLIGAKLGSKEILKRLMAAMKNDKGVQIESLLSLLGALAGFACQMCARAQIHNGQPSNGMEIIKVDCEDGATYFMGDAINHPLAEGQYSVWSMICGAAESNGAKPQDRPDLHALFKHVTSTLGAPEFGQPRLPSGFTASDTPFNYLRNFWPALQPIVERYCASPAEWPILYALAIQDVIDQASTSIGTSTPGYVAVAIAMESAVPMSKIDPALIGKTIPQKHQ
ncbi:MAG: DUF6585 family protein [Pseudomonadota bacterium]